MFTLFSKEAVSLPENVLTLQMTKFDGTEETSVKEAPVHPEKPQPYKLMPHFAVYDVKLYQSNDPTVQSVTGQASIELIKTKEGWSYKLNLQLQINKYDGTTTTIERNIASWESPSDISFHIENFRDGASETILQGGAERAENGEWRIYFEEPKMDGFITNQNIIFPIGHLENILEAIKNHELVLPDQIVFDATYEIHKPVRINTVITPLKDKNVAIKDSSLLPSGEQWCLKKALYNLDSLSSSPDYEENKIDIFSTGVISKMETSWGEGITVILNLKELTVYQ